MEARLRSKYVLIDKTDFAAVQKVTPRARARPRSWLRNMEPSAETRIASNSPLFPGEILRLRNVNGMSVSIVCAEQRCTSSLSGIHTGRGSGPLSEQIN